ncbi:MAG TPA: hypothetical protein PK447_10480 [Ignavibacteria bacterium]|nr:hypothetical protein [Ignavibacteria bacterium]
MKKNLINNVAIRVLLLLVMLLFINGVEFFHHHSSGEESSKCFSCLLINSLSSVSLLDQGIQPGTPHFEIVHVVEQSQPEIFQVYFKHQLRAPPFGIA